MGLRAEGLLKGLLKGLNSLKLLRGRLSDVVQKVVTRYKTRLEGVARRG